MLAPVVTRPAIGGFAQTIADSGLVTADADSRERMARVATDVDMPVTN